MLTALPVVIGSGRTIDSSGSGFLQKRSPMDASNPPGGSGSWRPKLRAQNSQRQREVELPYVAPFSDEVVTSKINRKIRHHYFRKNHSQVREHLKAHHIAKEEKWQGRHDTLEQNDRNRLQAIVDYYQERMQNADLLPIRRARAARYKDYYAARLSSLSSQDPPQTPPSSGGPSDPGTPSFIYGSIPGTPTFDLNPDHAGNWRPYE